MNTRKVRKILTPAITSVLVVTMTAGLALGMPGGRALAETYVDADSPVFDHTTNPGDWVDINGEMIAENNIGEADSEQDAIELEEAGRGEEIFSFGRRQGKLTRSGFRDALSQRAHAHGLRCGDR